MRERKTRTWEPAAEDERRENREEKSGIRNHPTGRDVEQPTDIDSNVFEVRP
ncbi:MAG TPA: hypothetical protein VKP64_04035 [Mycobacteriales bacterium]|nr:hypothetical protein [Mycobacteriales bacterium]